MTSAFYIEQLDNPVTLDLLSSARTAYFTIWNLESSNCTVCIRSGLLRLDGVLLVDVFQTQGIAAVTFDPQTLTTDDLITAIHSIGEDIGHFYGAELIGQESAVRALHLENIYQ